MTHEEPRHPARASTPRAISQRPEVVRSGVARGRVVGDHFLVRRCGAATSWECGDRWWRRASIDLDQRSARSKRARCSVTKIPAFLRSTFKRECAQGEAANVPFAMDPQPDTVSLRPFPHWSSEAALDTDGLCSDSPGACHPAVGSGLERVIRRITI